MNKQTFLHDLKVVIDATEFFFVYVRKEKKNIIIAALE